MRPGGEGGEKVRGDEGLGEALRTRFWTEGIQPCFILRDDAANPNNQVRVMPWFDAIGRREEPKLK